MVIMNNITSLRPAMTGNNQLSELSFTQALKTKYIDQEEIDNRFIVPKDSKISTEITFVGFGKVTDVQKQLKRLTNIDLSDMSIQTAGDLEELRDSLSRVRVLNLAGNFLTWREVARIALCLPNLCELILSGNKLGFDNVPEPNRKPNIKTLTLGRVSSSWNSTVGILAKIWGAVEQVDLWNSALDGDSMRLAGSQLNDFVQRIRSLKLSHNLFEDLSWLPHVGPAGSLIEIDLSKCQLERLSIDDEVVSQLSNLEFLNVSYNNLDDWESITSLHRLPKLKNLICHENPFFIREKHAKPLTIARLKGIKHLNREEISASVRRDSEILYLRRTFPEYQLFTKGENANFKSTHPRFDELAESYGLPEDLTQLQRFDRYVTVDLCFNEIRMTKKLPCDMKIANVKMLCKRLLKLRPSVAIQITCHDKRDHENSLNYILDQDGQTLHFFSVKNDHELLINLVGR